MIPALARNLLCAIACAALVAGCGGSGHKSSTTKSSTTTTKASTSTAPAKPSVVPRTLSEMAIAAGVTPATPASNVTVARGKAVVLRTLLPAKPAGRPQKLLLQFSRVNATTWRATATLGRRHSTATITSPGPKPMTLTNISYACPGPPVPSFCPLRHVVTSANSTLLQVTTSVPALTLVAFAGPVPGIVTPPPASKLVVPTYAVKELGLSEAPLKAGQKPPKLQYATTLSASPGDTIALATLLTGHEIGAPQPVTVSFAQGPAKTITASAASPGAPPSKVTIKSASGQPIELVSPVYRCSLPPTPSPCPATKIIQSAHRYSFTFSATPTSPIRMSILVQAG